MCVCARAGGCGNRVVLYPFRLMGSARHKSGIRGIRYIAHGESERGWWGVGRAKGL